MLRAEPQGEVVAALRDLQVLLRKGCLSNAQRAPVQLLGQNLESFFAQRRGLKPVLNSVQEAAAQLERHAGVHRLFLARGVERGRR